MRPISGQVTNRGSDVLGIRFSPGKLCDMRPEKRDLVHRISTKVILASIYPLSLLAFEILPGVGSCNPSGLSSDAPPLAATSLGGRGPTMGLARPNRCASSKPELCINILPIRHTGEKASMFRRTLKQPGRVPRWRGVQFVF